MFHRAAFISTSIANYKGERKLSFDRVTHSFSGDVSILCDGANSSFNGGDCAEICSRLLCDQLAKSQGHEPIDEAYKVVDALIKEQVSDSGCTAIAMQLQTDAICISGCGDSIAEVYRRGFLGWKLVYRSAPQLIEGTGNPSQLMGCPAYVHPFFQKICGQGTYAVLLMSDGMYKFTAPKDRLNSVSTLKSDTPSVHDLNYLLEDMAELSAANGAHDDISAVLTWARYGR